MRAVTPLMTLLLAGYTAIMAAIAHRQLFLISQEKDLDLNRLLWSPEETNVFAIMFTVITVILVGLSVALFVKGPR
jgi:hypothetical protein